MRVGQIAMKLQVAALALSCSLAAVAQEHSHGQEEAAATANPLVQAVRQATARFQDVKEAVKEGYALQFGCVTGDSAGAMGMHYVNGDIVNSGVLDVTKPQIVIYEETSGGKLHLIGADYLVFADSWNQNNAAPPQLGGQAFHLFTSPNQFNLPAFYTLHVWAWKDNPNGAFVNWHPNVKCENFQGASAQ
jgi:hypothetical protein